MKMDSVRIHILALLWIWIMNQHLCSGRPVFESHLFFSEYKYIVKKLFILLFKFYFFPHFDSEFSFLNCTVFLTTKNNLT